MLYLTWAKTTLTASSLFWVGKEQEKPLRCLEHDNKRIDATEQDGTRRNKKEQDGKLVRKQF